MDLPRLQSVPRRTVFGVAVTVALFIATTLVYYRLVDPRGLLWELFFFELRHNLHGWMFSAALLWAAVALSWRGFALTWLASFAVHLPRTIRFSLTTECLVSNLLFWLLPLLAGGIVVLERNWRATQRRIEAERAQEREVYLQKILVAQEEERRRIATEIHDETLQDMVALAYVADLMAQECPEDEGRLKERAVSIKENSLRMANELRRISSDLRPSSLDHLGLVPSLRLLAKKAEGEAGIPTQLLVVGEPVSLGRQAETAIFRIVQEALTNVRKHSEATEAWVTMEFNRSSLRLEISDNGRGLVPKLRMSRLASEGHLGLLGIRERVKSLGGSLHLQSESGVGTALKLLIPIPSSDVTDGSDNEEEP